MITPQPEGRVGYHQRGELFILKSRPLSLRERLKRKAGAKPAR